MLFRSYIGIVGQSVDITFDQIYKLSDQKEDLKGPISCEQRKIISSTRMMKMTGHLQTVTDELYEYCETKAFKNF